jgi:hypothetical protein
MFPGTIVPIRLRPLSFYWQAMADYNPLIARGREDKMSFEMRAIALASALSVACCATYQSIEPDVAAARKAWGDCIMNAVMRLDDGKTDPLSLAYGIGPQCAVEYQQLTDQMLRPMYTEKGIAYMREFMRANETKMITSAVLIKRRGGARDDSWIQTKTPPEQK